MTQTQVEFRYPDWGRLLTRFAEKHISRVPEIRISSPNRVVAVFNPALTSTEKTTLKEALPEWVKYFFEIELSDFNIQSFGG